MCNFSNYIQLNDWEIKKFLKIILTVQLAVWGVIGLDAIDLQIPIIRQLIPFIYLTFVPGILILRILKLHKLSNIETLLYTVGLSIATLMFTGLFMNLVYPLFGISEPISLKHLIITISAVVLLLCILSYVRDRDFFDPSFIDIKNVLFPPALFLCLVPFLAIFGTYLMNFYHNNILLMFLIVIITLIVLLIGFDRFIPKNLYPLAVFVIAISLLYHTSLISMYLWGMDIHTEYYCSNLVITNSIWDPIIPKSVNAMLSIVMLAPIYSIICNVNLTWVFKIIYPLLFSLVPLGLYRVFQKQTDEKVAFLSCFYFMSIFTFYNEMLQLARQQIAELFLVLLILLMIDKNMDKIKRSFLFIVFGISLAVSHYGLSYIYMFCLIFAWLILVLAENPSAQKLGDIFRSKFGRKIEKTDENPTPSKVYRTISSTFVLLFTIFALTWYIYTSGSVTFDTIVHVGNGIARSIFTDFLNPEAAQGLNIILQSASPLTTIFKYLHLIAQFFIVVGILTLLLKDKDMKFEKEYAAFSFANFIICVGAIALPWFANTLNTSRLYQITLFFLAPFCMIGGITVFRVVSRVVKASWTNQRMESSLKILSVFFAIFLLFNSGFVHELAKDPLSIALNNTVDYPCFNKQEVLGAKWVNDVKDDNHVYIDSHNSFVFAADFNDYKSINIRSIPNNIDVISTDSYIYLGTRNIVNNEIRINPKERWSLIKSYIDSTNITINRNKIYDNGGAVIYKG